MGGPWKVGFIVMLFKLPWCLRSVGALRCKVSPKCKKLRPLILASFLLSSALQPALGHRNLQPKVRCLTILPLPHCCTHVLQILAGSCWWLASLAEGSLVRVSRAPGLTLLGSPRPPKLTQPNPALLCLLEVPKLEAGVVLKTVKMLSTLLP